MDGKTACRLFKPLVSLFCACLLVSGGNAFAQTGKAELTAEIRSILQDLFERQRLVGLQAAVSLDGKLVFSEGIGLADMENQSPVSTDTRFEIASITKAFTGTVALMLSERGELDLDAPIQKYVSTFPDKTDGRRGGVVTARLIAGGLGGIRHYNMLERDGKFLQRALRQRHGRIGPFPGLPAGSQAGNGVPVLELRLQPACLRNSRGSR